MHNYHVVMASLNSPMAEYFPIVDVEVGNELFWYLFAGEPRAENGFIDLDDTVPGLGLSIDQSKLQQFEVAKRAVSQGLGDQDFSAVVKSAGTN